MKEMNFTDMPVWKKAHQTVLKVYGLSDKFPQKETFSLTSQLRRAVVSITSNIAEGFGRRGVKDKNNFYTIAIGSLRETQNQILIARDLKYITSETADDLIEDLTVVCRMIYALIKNQNLRLKTPSS
jgi:four helix bundle protein